MLTRSVKCHNAVFMYAYIAYVYTMKATTDGQNLRICSIPKFVNIKHRLKEHLLWDPTVSYPRTRQTTIRSTKAKLKKKIIVT